MNTKEAIEWIKTKAFCLDTMGDEKKLRDFECNQDGIISLLKRGEKYEQMWEEFQYYISGISKVLPNKMCSLEQKYFPKEGINVCK